MDNFERRKGNGKEGKGKEGTGKERKAMVLKRKTPDPTPWIRPNSRGQHWTEEQMRILDQITLEVTEAWAKDLRTIRKCHEKTKETVENLTDTNSLLEKLNEKIEVSGFLRRLDEVFKTQEEIKLFLEDVRQHCFRSEVQILGMRDLLVKALEVVAGGKRSRRRWWEFWK